MRWLLLSLCIALGAVNAGQAEITPERGAADARIRVTPFKPDEVYRLVAFVGFQVELLFEEGEPSATHLEAAPGPAALATPEPEQPPAPRRELIVPMPRAALLAAALALAVTSRGDVVVLALLLGFGAGRPGFGGLRDHLEVRLAVQDEPDRFSEQTLLVGER